MAKKILIGLLVILLFIQVMQPTRNQSERLSENDISRAYALPEGVHETLVKKCYDCHSNNTTYPWYTNIQPVGWWIDWHIREGKSELNFSTFGDYPKDRADHKLEEVLEVLEEGTMPLKSYLWMHRNAAVTQEESQRIASWIASLGIARH